LRPTTQQPAGNIASGFIFIAIREDNAMLVLSRRVDESIRIGEAVITIISLAGGVVKVGIVAPPSVVILRTELEKP